jgi:hypothetical protein
MQGGNKVESLQLTNEPHPYPQLRSLQREILQYTRADGVALNAELFLPPHYDPAKHGPLPCILWAYPRCASRHCCADALPCSWLACCCARRQSPAVASEHGVRLVRALHAWATACGARASSEPVCACPAEHEWHMCREFKSKAAAGQLDKSPFEFTGIGPSSPLVWLARGYAVLSGPSVPIIAERDEEPNDSYVQQLVGALSARSLTCLCTLSARPLLGICPLFALSQPSGAAAACSNMSWWVRCLPAGTGALSCRSWPDQAQSALPVPAACTAMECSQAGSGLHVRRACKCVGDLHAR